MCCCGLEFQFLSVPTYSRLPSRSTCSTFYAPNPPLPLEYNSILVSPVDLGVDSLVGHKLKDLHIFEAKDSKLSEIIWASKQGNASNGRYLVRREILYAKNESFSIPETSITSWTGGPSYKLCARVIRPSRDIKVYLPDFANFLCEKSGSQSTKINISLWCLSNGQAS